MRGHERPIVGDGAVEAHHLQRRHRDALAEALNSQEDGFGLDAAGVCISDAQRALARLTGEDATEATIDEVFSTFCVGK